MRKYIVVASDNGVTRLFESDNAIDVRKYLVLEFLTMDGIINLYEEENGTLTYMLAHSKEPHVVSFKIELLEKI